MERVGEMYDKYFYSIRNMVDRDGWYADNPGRTELDWLRKRWPWESGVIPPV
ncbi:MAG TPA: hypothetical protein VN808_20560 [Stellaceae bacterium]|nr:hypothetical protein [Stellaceae bacterium]